MLADVLGGWTRAVDICHIRFCIFWHFKASFGFRFWYFGTFLDFSLSRTKSRDHENGVFVFFAIQVNRNKLPSSSRALVPSRVLSSIAFVRYLSSIGSRSIAYVNRELEQPRSIPPSWLLFAPRAQGDAFPRVSRLESHRNSRNRVAWTRTISNEILVISFRW